MKYFCLGLLAAVSLGPAVFCQMPVPVDPAVEARANALLQKMTVEEKVGQLHQLFWDKTLKDDAIVKGELGAYLFLTDAKEINRVQHVAVEQSRLHIPLLIGFDVIHGFHTMFPVPLATAASWDVELNRKIQAAAAEEASAVGIRLAFAPMVDIARDPRWGRIVEGAGEDPFLGSRMAEARVLGFQGAKPGEPRHILACAKHFAGYGAPVGGRDYDAVYLSEAELENTYLPPFHAAVNANVACIMSAYMDLNDVPASGNQYLLRDVLRDRWKFDGFVDSDAWAVYNLEAHGFAKDHEDATLRGFAAGVNLDMGSGSYVKWLPQMLKDGRVTMAQIDDMVRPLLRAKIELGLFEHPYVDEGKVDAALHDPAHVELARVAEERSAVLLRNENAQLPLNKAVRSVAVIGPLADAQKELQGSWSFLGDPKQVVSVLAGIKQKLGAGADVRYEKGVTIKRGVEAYLNRDKAATSAANEDGIAAAVAAAKASEQVVLVLGENDDMSGEYASRASLRLPGEQQQLLEAVVAVGKPTTLVLVSGRPLDITWASTHVNAILQAWFPGQQGGVAIANLLFGDATPSGKLPVTWPRDAGQIPLYYNRNLSQVHEDAPNFASYYWDEPQFPLYHFGYGLSYTSFAYSNLKVSQGSIATNAAGLDVTVDVKNTGTRPADDVVQLYTHQRYGSASRPVRELKGFERVTIAAGETKTVTLHLKTSDLSFWSAATHRRAVEASTYDVWVGGDSTAALHGQFEVTAGK